MQGKEEILQNVLSKKESWTNTNPSIIERKAIFSAMEEYSNKQNASLLSQLEKAKELIQMTLDFFDCPNNDFDIKYGDINLPEIKTKLTAYLEGTK